jgi:2-keto-4-pentenoate hydratase/2-oxohepta-3-ene-1,7-dioic acid hydratase in catechol pathway
MKLVTFLQNGQMRLGALRPNANEQQIVDLNRADARLPDNMLAFLEAGLAARGLAQQALAAPPPEAVLERAAVHLKAPVPKPGKIICLGLNYRDHAAESNQAVPTYPVVFAKFGNVVIASGEPIVIPKLTQEVDYEAEFGVVIGKRGRAIAEAEALSYVAGYVPFHDVSARDYQNRTSQWVIGKTFDTFGPMGPALVTADEVPEPNNLNIELRIGDEVLQSSNTRHLIFSVPQIIYHLSAVMTLEPGDVIATGTPGGVGASRTPKRWLKPGDVVRIEIERLGTLENPVVAEA